MEEEKKMKTVILRFQGTGVMADILDADHDPIDSFYEMLDEFDEVSVCDEDGDEIQEIPLKALGKLLSYDYEDDEDYNKVTDWEDHFCSFLEPEEVNEDIASIKLIVSKITGEVELKIPEDEEVDPKKIRPLSICWHFPGEEPEVCFGILYDGVEYPMVLDMDSEKVQYEHTVWGDDSDDEDDWEEDEDDWCDEDDAVQEEASEPEVSDNLSINKERVFVDGIWYYLHPETLTATATYELFQNENNYKDLESIVIPSTFTYEGKQYTVTEIGESAFDRCYHVKSISIPETVIKISKDGFCSNRIIKQVEICDNVTSIGQGAFAFNFELEKVVIGAKVESIDQLAFYSDSKIREIIIRAHKAPKLIGGNQFADDIYGGAVLYVPDGCREEYKNDPKWSNFEDMREIRNS